MNGPSVDEVIVRVETKGEGSAAAAWHSRDLKPISSAHINATQNNNGTSVQGIPEPRIREDTNDAIWEELSSPNPQLRVQMRHSIDSPRTAQVSNNGIEAARVAHDSNSGINIKEALANTPASNGRRPASHLSLERMPTRSDSPSLLRDAEPRHRSLDFDIHINEPNLVVLQDTPVSKPLTERDFSFRPKRSDAQIDRTPSSNNSQRIVRMVSSSKSNFKPPPSPLQPRESRFPPLELRVDEEDDEDEEERRASDATSWRSESKRKLIDHGMEVKTPLTDGQVSSGKRGEYDEDRASRVSSAAAIEKNNQVPRTVTLSKELVKTKTKSRLVEVSFPSSPSVVAPSGRFEGVKKSTPQSPARPSVRKAEAEADEEDPFKDIDFQDDFRKGNFKAITVAQWVAFIVMMGFLVCSLTLKEFKRRQVWGLELWKWFLLVLVVLCGRLVSGWLIRLLVIIFEKNFLLRKKVLYFVYGLRKGVQNCLWLGLVLLAWKLMFDPRVERSTANHKTLLFITRVMECFLIAAFIWLGKLLLVKSLASSFHVTTFFDRIQESLYNQHVLEALSGPPLLDLSFEASHKPARRTTFSLAKGVAVKKDDPNEPIKIENLQKMSTQNVSAGLMKQLMNLVKHPGIGTLVSTFDENVFEDDESEEIEINSELEAKAAGKWIFKNVAQEGSEKIEKEDLLRFVDTQDVLKVLCLFEGGKDTGKITKKALKNWVVKVYQERRALAHSLNDTKTAVKELHRMSSVAVIIIIIVVWLLVLGIASTHVLLFVSSQLLLVGFMFSNTVKQIFEAIIFLFVMHPFDVGDWCIIDGTRLVVEEMKILSTVFLKADNEKVFYPNSVLATKPISNLYRSPFMKDFLDFSVHISTPVEKITTLKEKLTMYVNSKSEHWHPKFGFLVKELEDLNRMRLSVTMQHTINFQNFGDRLSRRSDLLLELKRIFAELGIEYHLLTQPVQINYGEAAPSVLANYPPPIVPYPAQVI